MRGVLLPAAGFAAVLLAGTGCGSQRAGAVPAGFVPLSSSAIGVNDYAVLGSAPCASGRCTTIVRTTDGGESFRTTPAPELEGLGAPGNQATLRYADHDDGFAFVTGAGGAFYATHDAGASWHRQKLGSLIALATGGDHVYTVTARCTADRCARFRFRRSPVSRDVWTSQAMPFRPDSPSLDLSAYGANDVWLLGTRAGPGASQYDVLARSTDAGQTFTVGEGPCFRDLGGALAPSSARVIWAVCPTGMLAGAARSTDGGITFSPLRTPSALVNSARLAPASDRRAILLRNGAAAPPLLTTDAGATWMTPKTPAGGTFWAWAGFTDAKRGAALVQTRYGTAAGVETEQLWRTIDGGSRWTIVRLR
jgi:photosystem II stability/assembly factor-like uncharacterized protein